MPAFLVKITWGKWQTDPPWPRPGELQAVALFDLRFSKNRLSMWKIEDDPSNLERIVAALATSKGKESIEQVDYVLLEQAAIQGLGVKIEKSKGGTLDNVANNDWHHDCVELCVSDVVAIANYIKTLPKGRKTETAVKEIIKKSLAAKNIDIEHVDEPLKSKLRKLG